MEEEQVVLQPLRYVGVWLYVGGPKGYNTLQDSRSGLAEDVGKVPVRWIEAQARAAGVAPVLEY
jgi:hypothetical protein